MRFLLLLPFALALSAQSTLAADPEPAAAQSVAISASSPSADAEAPKFQCHMESDIGSLRMHKVCTKVPTDAERRELQDSLRNNLPNNNLTHPAAGSGH